jgi:UDP-2-acetamido-3-amino-2,3-dideoxy-glucuronate N-acetyltransferase
MSSCKVGYNCIIGQNVYIDNDVVIGNGVKIQNNVSIYNGVEVEDDVFLGPSMVFTNIINPRSFIERKNEFQKTIIRKGATIGANATIVCGIEIGSFALIGAGAVIINNVPSYSLVVGNPGRQVGWVSMAGNTLTFDVMGFATCPQSGDRYRLLNNILQKL